MLIFSIHVLWTGNGDLGTKNGLALRFIGLGKPTENAVVDSFNGRLCEECLNEYWFTTLPQARSVVEA